MDHVKEAMRSVSQQHQSQQSLNDQLQVLVGVANKLGLYDAADYLKERAYK